jgi:hypothetical protein
VFLDISERYFWPTIRQSGVISTASVILMSSSFLSIAQSAPRTISATSADPCYSDHFEGAMMAASGAGWLSLIL